MDFTVLGAIDPEDIILFPLTFGLNSGESIERLVASVLRQKGLSPDITFAALSELKMGFRCYATELQTSQIKELSARTTPQMKVATGVRASMSFPLMYSPVKDGNSLLVDGGLLHNLPLVFLTDEEINETLGVFFVAEPKAVAEPVEGVLELFKYMYEAAIDMRNRPFLKKFKDRLIIINTDDFNGLDFSESKERRLSLIGAAYEATEKFLENRKPPIRRFSVC
jgi:predicted acylesterase/phospholipase RssA